MGGGVLATLEGFGKPDNGGGLVSVSVANIIQG